MLCCAVRCPYTSMQCHRPQQQPAVLHQSSIWHQLQRDESILPLSLLSKENWQIIQLGDAWQGEVQAPRPSPLLPPPAASYSCLAATTVWFGQKTMKGSRTLASNGEAVLFPAPAAAGVYVNFHGSFLLLLTGEASVVFSPPPPRRWCPPASRLL